MHALFIALATQAGKLLAEALRAKGQPSAASIVEKAETAARAVITELKNRAVEVSDTPLTAADVDTAVLAAMAEVDGFIADAERSYLSRNPPVEG